MSGLEPESLAETQARLAREDVRPGVPPVAERPARGSRRPMMIVVVAALLVSLAAGVIVFAMSGAPASDPRLWESYPGSSYREEAEVLAGDTMESVTAEGDAFVDEFRDALTERYGLEWTPIYAAALERDINGYGGESLLYSYVSGLWQGATTVDDPAARAEIEAIFARLTNAHGGEGAYTVNDLYEGQADAARSTWGAEDKVDQPLWAFDDDDASANLSFRADVFDSSLPADPAFDGDQSFDLSVDGTLFVTVNVTAYALLAEADRDDFLDALEPFAGKQPPESDF